MSYPTWQCLRCGVCCTRDNYMEELDIHLGIFLFPEERRRFKRKHVRPMWGIGTETALKVFAYQMITSPCPRANKELDCKIYGHRPIACQAYPVQEKMAGFHIDSRCIGVQRAYHVDADEEVRKIEPDHRLRGLHHEIAMSRRINDYQVAAMQQMNPYDGLWLYDFEAEKWVLVAYGRDLTGYISASKSRGSSG